MAGSTNISIRMDSDVKAQADALFNELGMNMTTAFNIFVRQSSREGRIPFAISRNQPNRETVAARIPCSDLFFEQKRVFTYIFTYNGCKGNIARYYTV